jgi:membrane protease YdiL (CAAX protease family)
MIVPVRFLRRTTLIEALAGAGALTYGLALDRRVPRRFHVPVNLAAGSLAVAFGIGEGVGAAGLGVARGDVRRGVRVGALCAPVIGAVLIGSALHPRTRRFFVDRDAVDATPATARFETLVRIPFGTALPEELLFRGALLGLLLRTRRPRHAVAVSSVLFGLWHVAPTVRKLRESHVTGWAAAPSAAARAGTLAGVVAVTTAAGVALSWLRLGSRSVAAPWIAHSAVNALSYLGARLAARGSSL